MARPQYRFYWGASADQWHGGSTVRGLKYIDEWLGSEQWDVIHFNFVAHDLMVMRGGKHQVAIEQYEANLRKLVARLRRTGARLVWASTTPMPEGKLLLTGTLGIRMSNADSVKYNAVAAKVMKEHGIPIDDLYAFALPKLQDLLIPMDVHLTFSGAAAIAEPVAESILAALVGMPATTPSASVAGSRPSSH